MSLAVVFSVILSENDFKHQQKENVSAVDDQQSWTDQLLLFIALCNIVLLLKPHTTGLTELRGHSNSSCNSVACSSPSISKTGSLDRRYVFASIKSAQADSKLKLNSDPAPAPTHL